MDCKFIKIFEIKCVYVNRCKFDGHSEEIKSIW